MDPDAGAAADPDAGAAAEIIPGFEAETDLERRLARDPALLEGLAWGSPRPGHPEGAVGIHVAHLLRMIDQAGETGGRRRELRFLSLVHDAMKGEVKEWLPRSGENHHAMRARRFAEAYTDDERLLTAIELHDRPYGIWRKARKGGGDPAAQLRAMAARIPDLDLFLCFVELDGSTEGKRSEPVEWVKGELARRTGDAG